MRGVQGVLRTVYLLNNPRWLVIQATAWSCGKPSLDQTNHPCNRNRSIDPLFPPVSNTGGICFPPGSTLLFCFKGSVKLFPRDQGSLPGRLGGGLLTGFGCLGRPRLDLSMIARSLILQRLNATLRIELGFSADTVMQSVRLAWLKNADYSLYMQEDIWSTRRADRE